MRNLNISDAGREILNLFIRDRLTVRQIATRRGTTYQAVYKIIQKLKKKGIINLANAEWLGVEKNETTPLGSEIRLHAQHWIIEPLLKTNHYQKNVRKRFVIDTNTIEINKDNIEVYSNKSFYGKDATSAHKLSLEYWLRFFTRLEHRLKTPLLKENRLNVQEVNAHFARVDDPLAKKCLKEKAIIRVKSKDGKTWLVVDNSFNLKELETVHPETAKQDMTNVVEPFFNDLKNNTVPLPSEAYKMQILNIKTIQELTESLKIISKRLDNLER